MQNADIRKIVDAILKSQKTLAGSSSWKLDPDGYAFRWLSNVEIDGEQPGVTLVFKYYPRREEQKFSIMLCLKRCFFRLDFTNEGHLNPLHAPECAGMLIRDPHYHPWSDNRRYATANSLPKKLQNARLLPESIKSFDPAVRWFLDETNIYADTVDLLTLPKRVTLL